MTDATEIDDTDDEFESVEDHQVYWTASFYIAEPRIPRCVAKILHDSKELRVKNAADPASRALADAMNPLFNDISDRERAGHIDDLMFAVGKPAPDPGAKPDGHSPKLVWRDTEEWIGIDMPADIHWETEGIKTTASPPGDFGPQKVRVRRFWYVHRNGALSWHISFRLDYGPKDQQTRDRVKQDRALGIPFEDRTHSPSLLYFLSRLQKVLAPKEFAPNAEEPVRAGFRVHRNPLDEREAKSGEPPVGIEPIDTTLVKRIGRNDAATPLKLGDPGVVTFWKQVSEWFADDHKNLFGYLCAGWDKTLASAHRRRYEEIRDDPFEALVGVEPFLEVPGLMMPRFRYMFFFVDYTFFNRLMPPLAADGVRLLQRAKFVHPNCYAFYLQRNEDATDYTKKQRQLDPVTYWKPVLNRDSGQEFAEIKPRLKELYDSLGDEVGLDDNKQRLTFDVWLTTVWLKSYKADKPAWTDDKRPDCINYLFLAGFNQNIIDFMAQDASEILDSLDPVYPDADDESGERFFVRYATPRGFITYVSASRSLESGNDWIGTCPYAFLIHTLALHNEYLARDYEINTESMITRIRSDNDNGRTWDAVQKFYEFRMGEYSDYARNRYGKVFRYDTEAKVFSEVEQRRGIERKTDYLNTIVENLEKQTSDLQARLQKREDRLVTYAVGGVGLFGLFSFIFDVTSDKKAPDQPLLNFGDFSAVDIAFWFVWGGAALVGVILLLMLLDAIEFVNEWVARTFGRNAKNHEWKAEEAPGKGKKTG